MTEPIIETRGLTKRFGRFTAVDHITLSVMPGEIFGFLGANGAGKTTTIKIITGLLAPDSGSIVIDGMDGIREQRCLKEKMGYVPDHLSAQP